MEQHDPSDDDIAESIEGQAEETRRRARVFRRPVELITDAELSPHQRRLKRERIYVILQIIRVPLLLLAMLVWALWGLWWLAAIIFVVSIPLPGVAVVLANEKGTKRDHRQQSTYKPAAARMHHNQLRQAQALEPPPPKEVGQGPEVIDADPDPATPDHPTDPRKDDTP